MEGLIPMVYKAMKRNRTRRQYSSLSSSLSSSASAAQTNYNIADFYIDPNQTNYVYVPPPPPAASSTPHDHHRRLSLDTIFNVNNNGGFSTVSAPVEHKSSSSTNNIINGQVIQHRRHKSVSVSVSAPPKQLVRFRSHRRIFSCMTCGVVPS
ncbi:PREDICTED: uncharacterized protein LOC103341345 [Prunus mume]|uniref:Uncharacterized protein LOC103341345 n=1 Tax=Prunus mume TaxID=102107 RepID=A0ABM0PQT2_PRUMU|nr:PREDICTED: uncharacterized protein LOC103341345 [Prunus mume]